MTYPKDKLTPGVDAPGVYLCEFKLRAHSLREIWWDGRDYWWDSGHGSLAVPEPNYTNFRPLSLAPEVVEGPTYESLPQGTWLLLNQHSGRPSGVVESNGSAVCDNGTYVKLDSLLAAITKPEPGVTERHREAAKKLAEVSPDDDAELLREYERILAGCFPAEAAK